MKYVGLWLIVLLVAAGSIALARWSRKKQSGNYLYRRPADEIERDFWSEWRNRNYRKAVALALFGTLPRRHLIIGRILFFILIGVVVVFMVFSVVMRQNAYG